MSVGSSRNVFVRSYKLSEDPPRATSVVTIRPPAWCSGPFSGNYLVPSVVLKPRFRRCGLPSHPFVDRTSDPTATDHRHTDQFAMKAEFLKEAKRTLSHPLVCPKSNLVGHHERPKTFCFRNDLDCSLLLVADGGAGGTAGRLVASESLDRMKR